MWSLDQPILYYTILSSQDANFPATITGVPLRSMSLHSDGAIAITADWVSPKNVPLLSSGWLLGLDFFWPSIVLIILELL